MTDKQIEHQAKKSKLIKLSQEAKAIQTFELETGVDDRNINSILIDDFYTDSENTIFKTFHDWRKENKKVKNPEKGAGVCCYRAADLLPISCSCCRFWTKTINSIRNIYIYIAG